MNRKPRKAVAVRVVDGDRVADCVWVADRAWRRLRGLLGSRELPRGAGLWIVPCRSIHTIGMRFPIDVVFLDARCRVLRTVNALRPGRMCFSPRGGHSVIELPAGALRNVDVGVGDRLEMFARPPERQPKARAVQDD